VRAYHHTYGLPVLTTNCSNNYGPYHFPEKLIPLMIVNALAGKPCRSMATASRFATGCTSRITARRSGACSKPVARAKPTTSAAGTKSPTSISCTPSAPARRTSPAFRRQALPRADHHVADRPGHDRRYAIDARKIENELGWKPAETFATGIRKTVLWYLENQQWVQQRAVRRLPRLGREELRRARAMRILLFGKRGQVGWELQRSLAPLGQVDRPRLRRRWQLCGDFTDLAGLAACVRAVAPDVIVNAAAHTAVDKAESEPELARTLNALAPGVLAEEASRLGAWLVHYSTDYVFDGSGESPWQESDPTGPLERLRADQARRRAGGRPPAPST
jgi:nucleoside-diphosphate-sugar epimerase